MGWIAHEKCGQLIWLIDDFADISLAAAIRVWIDWA